MDRRGANDVEHYRRHDTVTDTRIDATRARPLQPESGKIVSAEEAVRLIRDGDTIATGGFVGIGFAEEIAVALEELHLS